MNKREKIYRIIDVNLNRASEGLRVIEDGMRFVLNDLQLTQKLRKLRHSLKKVTEKIPEFSPDKLISYRDSEKDVGIEFQEGRREGFKDLIRANFRRVEEAERSLEEFSKLLSLPSLGMEFKKFRFQTYCLEKEVETRLRDTYNFTLYVIADPNLMGEDFEKKIQDTIHNGATVIQLREKNSSTLRFLERALMLKEIISKKTLFIVNDRVDIAIASQADGVHLGQDDLPVPVARQILGEDKIIGVSTHSIKEAQRAEEEGANYIAIGPIFSTQTKPDSGPPKGVSIISQVKKKVHIPVIAIGGINKENVQEVLKAGADGIAVISAVFKSENVGLATRKLFEIIKRERLRK